MKKILAGLVVFIVGVTCGLIFAYGPLYAQSSVIVEGGIMSKLDEILSEQKEVAAMINSMKEDIEMIKIRVTQMQ